MADVVLSVDLASAAYRIGLRYRAIGLASLVSNDRVDARTRGHVARGRSRA